MVQGFAGDGLYCHGLPEKSQGSRKRKYMWRGSVDKRGNKHGWGKKPICRNLKGTNTVNSQHADDEATVSHSKSVKNTHRAWPKRSQNDVVTWNGPPRARKERKKSPEKKKNLRKTNGRSCFAACQDTVEVKESTLRWDCIFAKKKGKKLSQKMHALTHNGKKSKKI